MRHSCLAPPVQKRNFHTFLYLWFNKTQTAPNVRRWDELSCLPRGKGPDWDVFLRTELLTPISRAVEMNPTAAKINALERVNGVVNSRDL